MKKTLLIVAIAAFAMTSCKKDRVCECTSNYTYVSQGFSGSGTDVSQTTYQKTTKRTAKLACIHRKQTQVDPNTTFTIDQDCKLK